MSRSIAFSITHDDCEMQTFRAGGNGGQNQNKRDTGVRYIHRPSGAVGESREERSQWQNRLKAWKRMANHPKMRAWIARQLWIIEGLPTPEEMAAKAMAPENIKIEYRDERGRWVEDA